MARSWKAKTGGGRGTNQYSVRPPEGDYDVDAQQEKATAISLMKRNRVMNSSQSGRTAAGVSADAMRDAYLDGDTERAEHHRNQMRAEVPHQFSEAVERSCQEEIGLEVSNPEADRGYAEDMVRLQACDSSHSFDREEAHDQMSIIGRSKDRHIDGYMSIDKVDRALGDNVSVIYMDTYRSGHDPARSEELGREVDRYSEHRISSVGF